MYASKDGAAAADISDIEGASGKQDWAVSSIAR